MKKFLFTLFALFMAGGMFAGENYFYMDDITLTKEEAANGCVKVVDVKAHFDEAVSAWQAFFTLPEGVTISTHAKGADLTLTYLGQFEDEETLETYYQETTLTPDVKPNADKTSVVVSVFTATEYDDAHNGYALCWRPGDYEQMWRIRLVIPAGFKGGDIVLESEPGCSQGVWPGLTPCQTARYSKTTKIRIKADTPVIGVTGDDYSKTVTITAEDGATIYYSTDGENYQVYTEPIVFDEEGTYKVYAYAEGPGEDVEQKTKSDVAESDEFTIQAQANPAPAATITNEGNVVTAAVDGEEAGTHTVELYIVTTDDEGNEVLTKCDNNPYTVTQTYEEQKITFIAKTLANDDESEDTWSEPKEITIPALEKKTVAAPKITYVTTDTEVVVTVTWPESDGEKVYTGQYTYTRTDVDQSFDVEAYVTEGETCKESAHATETIPVPKKEVIATPEITFSGEETTTMTITVSCATADVTLYVNGEAVEGNPYTYTVTRDDVYTAGTVNVTAVAKKGDLESETANKSKDWVVQQKETVAPPTFSGAKDDDGLHFTITITPGVTDGELVYDATPMGTVLNGAKAQTPSVQLQYERKAQDYDVELEAYTAEGTIYAESDLAEGKITVPALDTVEEPVVEWKDNGDGTFDVWATSATEGATITLTDGDKTYEVANGEHVTITFDTEEGYEGEWYAEASKTNMQSSESEVVTIEIAPVKVYQTPDPVIGDAVVGDQNVTIPVTGVGHIVVTVEINGETKTYEGDNSVNVVIPRGEDDDIANITATAMATTVPEGYTEISTTPGKAEKTGVDIPALPKTKEPTIDVSFGGEDGAHYANVTFVNNDEKSAVIEYSLDGGQTWITYTGAPVVITNYGENTVMARATAEGKQTSDEVERTFTLNDDPTSVNELTNGKAVAGVRYFNMAGQEMQEANGITIVVTTYTDGTTSAVKVIK